MNKMREYERGREDGLDLARRIVRQGGIEALEQECKFRGVTGIHTSLAVKDLDKASEKIKEVIADSFVILSIAVLHDDFGLARNAVRDSEMDLTGLPIISMTVWQNGLIM